MAESLPRNRFHPVASFIDSTANFPSGILFNLAS